MATNNTAVTLALTCGYILDANSNTLGCTNMKFSNDNITWSTAEPFATSKNWILPATAGSKKVYVKIQDSAGLWQALTSSIYYDVTAPATTTSVAAGLYNTAKIVALTCTDATSGCAKTNYTTDGSTPTTSSSIYTTPLNIAATTTLKYFSVDAANNGETVKSTAYIIDTTPPTGTIVINGGATTTTSSTVTLTLSCSDANGCDQMKFSNNNSSWSTPQAFATTKLSWALTTGTGLKTVYVQFKDLAGNWSPSFSSNITR